MTVTLYGIKNCDTIKKARKWLEQAGVDYRFVDHRADGLDPEQLAHWLEQLGWEQLLNKRGTTYRALSDADKAALGPESAAALLQAHPAMIKRPLLDLDGELHLGFKPEHYARLFNQ
ncbi:ArsC family reductase [Oceanimonas sp. MB9]|uniref:ArsC family reductase n=1 Tax=Oceanimonas sp. MB9 TaxID=2588453 RepID=UPI0013F5B371|nr:ArsC family reductase [Oceanimonas sp. MB9]NHI01798.1 Regulatory protein Spx [Oceanimonas sp. MB9]